MVSRWSAANTTESGFDELFLKPGAEVSIDGSEVRKKMNKNEASAYKVLSQLSAGLSLNGVNITTPTLIDYDNNTKMGRLTYAGQFRHYNPMEYFGEADVYTEDYFAAILGVFNILRKKIPVRYVDNKVDHESTHKGLVALLVHPDNCHHDELPRYFRTVYYDILPYIQASQTHIESLKLYAGHKDPNPNNYLIKNRAADIEVVLVDWETFGLSRIGYDEGRFFTYLALDAHRQDAYVRLVRDRLYWAEMVYFWRVALMRAYREMTSVYCGHYDSRFAVFLSRDARAYKETLVEALYQLVVRSRHELQLLLSAV